MNSLLRFAIPKRVLAIVFSGLILSACIEHQYYITVLPQGGAAIKVKITGDPSEFGDDNQLMPDSIRWQLTREIENGENEQWIWRGNMQIDDDAQLNDAMDWMRGDADTVHLQRKFDLKRTQKLFGVLTSLTVQFNSRRFTEKYGDMWDFIPADCRILEDDEKKSRLPSEAVEKLERQFALGVIQWNRNRYERLLDRVWEIAIQRNTGLKDTSKSTLSIARAGWADDLRLHLNQLDVDQPSYTNLDWWSDLRPIFLGRLIDLTSLENLDRLAAIADILQYEYQITQDLKDDTFEISVRLPGWGIKTNGEKDPDDKGLVVWKFNGEELMNEAKILNAHAFEPSLWRIGAFAVLVMILLRWARLRRKRTK